MADAVAEALVELVLALEAESVLCFATFRDEIDTAPALRALRRAGRTTLVPVVVDLGLLAVPVEDDTPLSPGARGTPEPPAEHRARAVEPDSIDLVVVPGLAFAPSGVRLGYGGGYYDRFLPLVRPGTVRLGLGYAAQLVETLPGEAHDVLLDAVLTEEGLVVTDAGKARGVPDATRLAPTRARGGEGRSRPDPARAGTARPESAGPRTTRPRTGS